MYDYADKVAAYLIALILERFNRLSISDYKAEAQVFQKVRALYKEIDELVKLWLVMVASQAYESAGSYDGQTSSQWLNEKVLDVYDAVTKYAYNSELERKADRFAESIIASSGDIQDINTAARYMTAMVKQYLITTVDTATVESYKSQGISEVVWKSVPSANRCSICLSRDGNVYPIDKIPPKPHLGCRCYFLPKGAVNER